MGAYDDIPGAGSARRASAYDDLPDVGAPAASVQPAEIVPPAPESASPPGAGSRLIEAAKTAATLLNPTMLVRRAREAVRPGPENPGWGEVVAASPAVAVASGKGTIANLARLAAENAQLNIAEGGVLGGGDAGNLDARDLAARAGAKPPMPGGFRRGTFFENATDVAPAARAPLEQEMALDATKRAEEAIRRAAEAKREEELVTPKNQTLPQKAFTSLVSSAPPQLAALGAGILTRSPALAMAIGGGGGTAMQAGSTFGEARDKLASVRTATRAAMVQGGIEALDALPIGIALKPGTATRNRFMDFLKKTGKTSAAEAGTEGLQQVGQDIDSMIEFDPNMTVGQMMENAAVAMMAGAGGGATIGAVAHAAEASNKTPQERRAIDFAKEIDRFNTDEIPHSEPTVPRGTPPPPPPPPGPKVSAAARQAYDELQQMQERGKDLGYEELARTARDTRADESITRAEAMGGGYQPQLRTAMEAAFERAGIQRPTSEREPLPGEPQLDDLGMALTGSATRGQTLEESRLTRTLNRDEDTGAPANERTVLQPEGGAPSLVVGRLTRRDWLNRAERNLPEGELDLARKWYDEINSVLEPIFKDRTPDVLRAWLLSQQRARPSQGMMNVFRALDRMRGLPGKQAGLNEKALIQALRGVKDTEGMGAKLADFIDSAMGRGVRTVVGGDERGGQPAAIDVHAYRDTGFIDSPLMAYIQRTYPKQAKRLKEDLSLGKEPSYEYGVRFYNDLAQWLNKVNYRGGGWTAPQAQAVGWMAMQKQIGLEPETAKDIISKNTRRVSLGLSTGQGAPRAEGFAKSEAEPKIRSLAKITGVNILSMEHGTGAYLGDTEMSFQIDALASPESVKDFMDALGYAFQQSSVIAHRALKTGKSHAFEVEGVPAERANEFFQRMRAHTDLAVGFQPTEGGIKLLNFGAHWSERQILALNEAASLAADDLGVQPTGTLDYNVELQESSNDWTKQPDGKAYTASLRKRGRLREAEQLEREHAPGKLDQLGRGARRSADQSVGQSPETAIATAGDAKAHELMHPPSPRRLGKCHLLVWRKVTGSQGLHQVVGLVYGMRHYHVGAKHAKIWHSVAKDSATGNFWEPIADRWYTPEAMKAYGFAPVMEITADETREAAVKSGYYTDQTVLKLRGADKKILSDSDVDVDESIMRSPELQAKLRGEGVRDEREIVNNISRELSPQDKVSALGKLTEENKPLVAKFIETVASRVGVESKASVKAPEKILAKAKRPEIKARKPWFDVEHVRDSFRFKSVLKDVHQLPEIAHLIKSWGWEAVKVDTAKVLAPLEWGWRIAAVDLRLPNGQLVEYYAPVAELEAAKDKNHVLFEKWREQDLTKLTPAQQQDLRADMNESRDRYEAAWQAYLKRTGQTEADVAEALTSFSRTLESGRPISSSSEAENATPSRQEPSTSERAPASENTTARVPSPEQKTSSMAESLAGEGARRDGFSGKVTARTLEPSEVGMDNSRPVPAYLPKDLVYRMNAQQAGVVAAALRDIGAPRWLHGSVSHWITMDQLATSNSAMYFPPVEGIAVREDHLAAAVRGSRDTIRALRGYIAHELGHQLDSRGAAAQQSNFSFDAFSHDSPRLAYTMDVSFDTKTGLVNDGGINPTGDLMTEATDLYYLNGPKWMQDHLAYPLSGVGQYDDQTVKSEVFAQMHTLYFTARADLQRHAPKWYALFEDIYGKEAAAESLPEARERLREALQVARSSVRAEGAGVRAKNPAGARERVTGQGVAGGAGQSQRPAGGGTQPPAANRHGAAAGSTPGVNWNVDQPGVADALIRAFQNNQLDLKAVQDAIIAAGGIIQSATDPYLTDELAKSRYAERIKRFDKQMVEPLLRSIKKAGLTAEDVGRFLWARHAPEANAKLAQLNPGLQNPSGMSDAEAQKVMDQFRTAGKLVELRAIAAQVDAMTKATRQLYVQEGLESQKTVDEWANTYKHYVPLHREIENPAPGPGKGFKIIGPETKRRLGSQRPAVGILAAVIGKHHNAIIRAEKARVGRDLIKLAEEFPNADFWRVDQPPLQRYVNPSSGLVEMRIDPQYKQREDVFLVKEKTANGDIRERVLAFNPHNERAMRLSHAMQKLDVAEMTAMTKIVGKATRFLANLATQWNPVFWSTNLARDVGTMAVNLQSTPLKGKAPRVMMRMPAAMAGIADATWRSGNSKYAKLWKEFAENGGPTGFYKHFENLVEHQAQVEKMVAQMGQGKGDPRVWGRWGAEQVSNVNSIIENSTRLAVYALAREQGSTAREAASIAKNITVNFDRRGNMSLSTNAWYMFFNANAQGTARLVQALAKSPRARATVGALTALGAAMYVLNMLIGDADKDEYGNNPYELIPDWEKQRNWIFMIPKSKGTGKEVKNDKGEIIGRYVKIPLPYGFNIFPALGRIAAEAAMTAARSPLITEKRSALEMAGDFANVVIDSFSPLGQTATPIQTIAPTIADPFVQIWENKKFTGTAMVPDRTQFNQQVPRSQLYFNSNSELAKDTAAWLNRATGGDDLRPGSLDVYPGHIEHTFSTLTGGPGTFAMGWLDWGTNITRRALGHDVEPTRTSRIPFVGKFYGEVDERAVEAKFFRIKKKADEEYGRYRALRKAGEIDEADAIEAKNPALIDFAREVSKSTFRKEQKELRNEMKGTRELPIIDRSQAKDQIRRSQSELYQRALEAYNAAASEGR